MNTLLYLLPVCIALHMAPKTNTITNPPVNNFTKSFFRFGDQLITLEKYAPTSQRSYVIVSLHSNEAAAIKTSMAFAQLHGAAFYRLMNRNKRNVEANLLDKKISFDPNNIFTSWGRRTNLKMNKCWDGMTNKVVQQFANFLRDEMLQDKTIVSVHNTDNQTTIKDFINDGKLHKQVKEMNQNPELDAANFFMTGEEKVYHQLKAAQFNVVLLNKAKIKDDGSLHVYCMKANHAYVHIQTSADQVQEQQRMLTAIDSILR